MAGTATNVIFQAYTAFRGVFQPRKLCRHLMDAFFTLAMLSAVSGTVFIVNWGELRLYVPLSLALGFLISGFLIGDVAYGAAYRCFRSIKIGAGWVKRNIVVPSERLLANVGAQAKKWMSPNINPPEAQDETPPDHFEDLPPDDTEPTDGLTPPKVGPPPGSP